ncbi:MAG TPA: M56 family metallopeptidase [Pirellulales bacterium]
MFEFARYLADMFRAPPAQFLSDVALKATLLLAAAILAAAPLRRSSAAVRHRLWCLTFVGLLLLPGLSAVLPQWRIAVLPDGDPLTHSSPLAPREKNPFAPQAETYTASSLAAVTERSNAVERSGLPLAEREGYYGLSRRQAAWSLPKVVMLWLSGALLSLLPFALGFLRNHSLRRHARPLDDANWQSLLIELGKRLALSRQVELYETGKALMPMTWGVLRPIVMLPRQARDWSERSRRIVLLHELAHIKRCDVGFQILGRVACALYWFHPLVWHALRRLRIERELACDDCVVLAGERASDYAAELLQIARACRPVYFAASVAMAQRGNLEHRLLAMFDRARSHLPVNPRAARALLAGVLMLVTTIAAVRLEPHAMAKEDAPPSNATRSDEAEAAAKPSASSTEAPKRQPAGVAHKTAATAGKENPAVTLRGRVLLPAGKPAAGAALYWAHYKALPPAKPGDVTVEKRATADGDGRFEFSLGEHDAPLDKAPRPLLAHLPGYGVDWLSITSDDTPREIVLRLVTDNPLRGRVIDSEGRRVAGAEVTVRVIADAQGENLDRFLSDWKRQPRDARRSLQRQCLAARLMPLFATVTDQEGRFELSGVGAERVASVNISARGLVSADLEIVNRAGFNAEPYNKAAQESLPTPMRNSARFSGLAGPVFEHVAETELVVHGEVHDARSGHKAVAGAIVSMQARGINNPISTRTDEQGRFELRGVPRDSDSVLFVHPPKEGNLLVQSKKLALAPGQTVFKVDIELKEGAVVEGRVFDQATGRGVKSSVRFIPLPENEQPSQFVAGISAANTTDDDGRFRLLAMPGVVVLMAQAQPEEQRGSFRASLQRRGKPNAYRQATFSEEDRKRANVTEVAEDLYFTDNNNVRQHLGSINAVKVLDLKPGGKPTTCDLALDPGKTTTINIEDGQGQPVVDTVVSGVADVGQRVFQAAEATRTVYGLGADRPRLVWILQPQRHLAASVILTGDEPGPAKVRLDAAASISGRAVDADGEPLANAIVQITYQRRTAAELFWSTNQAQPPLETDADGRFRVENILPGERLAITFRYDGKFFAAPRITDEKHQLAPGEKLDLGEFKAQPLQ